MCIRDRFRGQVSKYRLEQLAQQWELRGWLTGTVHDENGHKQGRLVTDELLALCASPTDMGAEIVTSCQA